MVLWVRHERGAESISPPPHRRLGSRRDGGWQSWCLSLKAALTPAPNLTYFERESANLIGQDVRGSFSWTPQLSLRQPETDNGPGRRSARQLLDRRAPAADQAEECRLRDRR